MSEDQSTTGPAPRSWWGRLGHMLSGEPRNRDDLLDELRSAEQNGLISADTLGMVEGALEFTDLRVSDVMITRSQMVALTADEPLEQVLATVIESGHSRFPVYDDQTRDAMLGVLLAKDLLKCFADGNGCDLRAMLRPAMLIPETMPLNVLLAEFKLSRNHMAIVVDEYGGVDGLVTVEDVLEEIVGEIDDEHDDEDNPELIRSLADDVYLVSALTPIDEFNDRFACDFSDEEFDTVGGMVTAGFGHLPERGEEVALGKFSFHVTESDDRRVHQFRVEPRKEDA